MNIQITISLKISKAMIKKYINWINIILLVIIKTIMILKNLSIQKIKNIINNYGILVVLKPHKIRHCGALTDKKMNVNQAIMKIIKKIVQLALINAKIVKQFLLIVYLVEV